MTIFRLYIYILHIYIYIHILHIYIYTYIFSSYPTSLQDTGCPPGCLSSWVSRNIGVLQFWTFEKGSLLESSGRIQKNYHLVMTNIAMENPQTKWRLMSLGKSSISMGHGFHGYVKLPGRVCTMWSFPKSWGDPKKNPKLDHDLVLKPMVSWESPITRNPHLFFPIPSGYLT